MPFQIRPRWPGTRGAGAAALTVALLALSACSRTYPNSVFHSRSDFNRDAVGHLFTLIIWLGAIVFVLVEGLLLYTMWKYRSRPGQREPEHVHGNTTLEILWTIIPALILAWIAIPTVTSIFRTEAPAPSNSLQVEAIGHQWWWEFRIPEYKVVTANELYLPLGRPVNFKLTSVDVIHSFWIPALAGKRDVMPGLNHANYIWFTPDSMTERAFNGVCVEFCGASHANMRFRAFVVSPAEFESWAKYQATPAALTLAPPAPPPAPLPAGTKAPATKVAVLPPAPVGPVMVQGTTQPGYTFAASDVPVHILPTTPLPPRLSFDDGVLAQGNAARGAALLNNPVGPGGCYACHSISGMRMMVGSTGPNLTHVASRYTIAAGLYPNDAKHLALWIKNARLMKPGVLMPTLGDGQIDPQTKAVGVVAKLTDPQIADIVAYLRALK